MGSSCCGLDGSEPVGVAKVLPVPAATPAMQCACTACDGTGKLLGEPCPLCGDAVEMPHPVTIGSATNRAASSVLFEGAYLSMVLPGGSEETYIALTPPGPVDNHFVKESQVVAAM